MTLWVVDEPLCFGSAPVGGDWTSAFWFCSSISAEGRAMVSSLGQGREDLNQELVLAASPGEEKEEEEKDQNLLRSSGYTTNR